MPSPATSVVEGTVEVEMEIWRDKVFPDVGGW